MAPGPGAQGLTKPVLDAARAGCLDRGTLETLDTEKLAGKYAMLRRLAAGGMAEVWLARQEGLSGFEKLVVIKRIHPHLAEDPGFVRMFLDEARASADLRHSNVVTVFEIGEDQGSLFLVMEYLHGSDVRQLFRGCVEKQQTIPLPHALQIVCDAAHGLAYAHRKTDLYGQPLGIVHRDVSPSNIVLTHDGATKIVDFGIAKAATQAQETTVGQLKGKVTYMSPEQVSGGELDHRSDQFSLGIVLWELTTMRRLFALSSEAAVARAIVRGEIQPPSEVVPEYPPELEAILMRALSPDRANRFEDCDEFASELEAFLAEKSLPHSPARLGRWVREQTTGLPEPTPAPRERSNPSSPSKIVKAVPARTLPADAPTNPGGKRHSRVDIPAVSPALAHVARDDEPTQAGLPAHENTPAEDSSAGTTLGSRTNLPADGGSFVGRRSDLKALEKRFLDGARLVTLLGPGGTGKTRLAVRFGTMQLDAWRGRGGGGGGVWFADLSSAESLDDVVSAVANALGVTLPTTGEKAVQQLGHALAGRGRLLLVLDNFEQVLQHAPATLGRWTAGAPEVRFLVTSRELLRLPTELAYDLEPLSLPVEGEDPSESEAVQLFLDRARAARPDLKAEATELREIGEIVTALDGLPLAIELAAARIRVFSPKQLLERLPRRFELLSSPRRDGGERQATLRGAIEWSWKLLAPHEQAALVQCSVFRGGFSLESAEAVLDLGAFAEAPWVPDVVQVLREKSLLRASEEHGELRFGMYESIRAWTKERFSGDPAAAQVVSRHASHYLTRGETWAKAVDGEDREISLARLAADAENLAAVHERASSGTPSAVRSAVALRAALVLERLLAIRGPFGPMERRLANALERCKAAPVDAALAAKGHLGRSHALQLLGRFEEALVDLEPALALARAIGDASVEAEVRLREGRLFGTLGRMEEAERAFLAAAELARVLGDLGKQGAVAAALGDVRFYQGRIEEMESELARAVELCGKAGDVTTASAALLHMGYAQYSLGRLKDARQTFQRAIEVHSRRKERRFEAQAHYYQGQLLHEEGELPRAREHFERALRIHRATGDRKGEGDVLYFLGTIHQALGRSGEALACYDQALVLARETGEGMLEAMALAMTGAAQAALDRVEAADKPLAAAEERSLSYENPLLLAMVNVCRGHLDLAQERRALATKDAIAAAVWRDLAQKRVEDARRRGEPDEANPEGTPSSSERSDDVRLALRLLEAALQPKDDR